MKSLFCSILVSMFFSTLTYANIKRAKCAITSREETKEITLTVGHIDLRSSPSLIIFKDSDGQEDIVIYLNIVYNGESDIDPDYYNDTKNKYTLYFSISKSSSKMKGIRNGSDVTYNSSTFPFYGIISGHFANTSPLDIFDQYEIEFSCKAAN